MCRAELTDVLGVEEVLREHAAQARAELERLKGASVVVPAAPAAGETTAAPAPVPEGEQVTESPSASVERAGDGGGAGRV